MNGLLELYTFNSLSLSEEIVTMGTPVKLLVIFGENNCERLSRSMTLKEKSKQLRVFEDFRLQYKDPDFNDCQSQFNFRHT